MSDVPTPQTSGGDAAKTQTNGARTGVSLFLNLAGDLLDKLTDVLNFGRILSIGIPGFIAAFGPLMLFALCSAPMPTRWQVTGGTSADAVHIAFRFVRQFKIDDVRDVVDIDAARVRCVP